MFYSKTVTIDIAVSDTICIVKEKIYQKVKVSLEIMKLYYEGKLLKDDSYLVHYGI